MNVNASPRYAKILLPTLLKGRGKHGGPFYTVVDHIVFTFLSPMAQRYATNYRRLRAIQRLEKQRSSRVITLIRRQESIALLGLPLSRFIDIDDSEALLRAIRLTPDNLPIDLVIHTPAAWS